MKHTDNKQMKIDANNEIKDELFNMNIHDCIDLFDYIRVTRVFNGWVYTNMHSETKEAITSTFVPELLHCGVQMS